MGEKWNDGAFWAEAAGKLHQQLTRQGVPEAVVQAAVAANPWFTPFYIRHALESVLPWFEPGTVYDFLAAYPLSQPGAPRQIGVIAAGNVPLVGLHDVYMTLLSGHMAEVKCSHQDAVLLPWLMQQWANLVPGLAERFVFSEKITRADAVIATGSNNTARYLEAAFGHGPLLLRKNRFSVALPRPDWPDAAYDALAADMLLYNGLGCRNVSNLILTPDNDLQPLLAALTRYPADRLNPAYVRKLRFEQAKARLLGKSCTISPSLLLAPLPEPGYAVMGWGFVTLAESVESAREIIASRRADIQCVVDTPEMAGQTQRPGLADFADDHHTLLWLQAIGR